MGQVTVTLNGRTYRLRCGDGEEPRLLELAAHVRQKIETLAAEFGQVGDDRLMVMAALLVADDLFDARARLADAGIVAAGAIGMSAAPPPSPPMESHPPASGLALTQIPEPGSHSIAEALPPPLPAPEPEPVAPPPSGMIPPPPPPSTPRSQSSAAAQSGRARRQSLHERLAEAREQPFTAADRKTGSD